MRWRKRRFMFMALVVPVAGLAFFRPGAVTPVRAFDPTKAPEIQDRLLDAAADIELGYHSPVAAHPPPLHNYQPSGGAKECPVTLGNDVKINQGCLNITAPDLQGRGQAQNETAIAANPNNSNQLVAASNDYTLGDGLAGGIAYSGDGGNHWQNSTLPLEFTRGSDFSGNSNARMYWQGGGDPSVAWDSRGNAYFAGLHFNRGLGVSDNPDNSSGVFVYRSTGNGGASWNFPGTAVATSFQPSSLNELLDKPYMAIDSHKGSPFQDRIYVTWTDFAPDGSAYIWEAHSSDYGRSFSSPALVSTDSALCANTFGAGTPNGNCNENQFSDPFTGSDGNMYVVFANFNNAVTNASDNHNQMLLVKSTDGGATFSAPVLAGNYYDLPDCATYQGGQDAFRSCVPEQGTQQDSVFRATNYPSGAVNPTNASQIVVTFGSYINSGDASTCTPNGTSSTTGINLFNGVKTSACSNKILVSISNDGASSFTDTDPSTMPTANGATEAGSDQWFQWSAFSASGKIVVSYYDRQYGSDETTGSMDFTLSSSEDPNANQLSFVQKRVTGSSMPVPTQFPDSQGNSVFFGDYTGLAVSDQGHPLWADTRDRDLFDCAQVGACSPTAPPFLVTASEPSGITANDEDTFTARIGT